MHAIAECVESVPGGLACPRPAPLPLAANHFMSPSCLDGECGTRIGALLDGNQASSGATSADTMPYVMIDLGFTRADVKYVILASVADVCTCTDACICTDMSQSQVLSVYLSASKPFNASDSVLCHANITYITNGGTSIVCPSGVPARYVTVIRSHANMVSYVQGPAAMHAVKRSVLLAPMQPSHGHLMGTSRA